MKKLISVIVLVFITATLFVGCKESVSTFDQMSNIKKPITLYDINLRGGNDSYKITLKGGDNKYYEFEGNDIPIIQTVIKRYGIGQIITDFDDVVVDSVGVEDLNTLTDINNTVTIPEKEKVETTTNIGQKWNSMKYDDKYELLSYTLYLTDYESSDLAKTNWNKIPKTMQTRIAEKLK